MAAAIRWVPRSSVGICDCGWAIDSDRLEYVEHNCPLED